jgi:hypothetical protein
MTFAAASSRTLSATAAAPATAVWHLPGAASARARLETGLIAGDPTGETILGWTVALDLMDLYQLTDSDQARTRANELITNLAELPDPRDRQAGRYSARLGEPSCSPISTIPRCPTDPPRTSTSKSKPPSARGYRNFQHYRLRLLLDHSRIHEDHTPTRIRTRRPSFVA